MSQGSGGTGSLKWERTDTWSALEAALQAGLPPTDWHSTDGNETTAEEGESEDIVHSEPIGGR
jgi:hypothetical protein